VSRGGHAKNVIFLTADAFGVLPPVSLLTRDQTEYHFLSGYTSKVAGTELGVREPQPTFSACFGGAFLSLHPTVYSRELMRKIEAQGARAYLVNTGWIGGPYGIGSRIDIASTRRIIHSILDGVILDSELETLPVFDLRIPRSLAGIQSSMLNPRSAWPKPSEWDAAARSLARRFCDNYSSFTDNEHGRRLSGAGPHVE
ncbi:MAG TPA: phosphoenolpyruvate carboxykinase (ATP), partial [Spirochaetia bacterium]|nr:phosphoenolpyruvate carboxykinase (ATP) [Spirochaetia bacterium]